MTAGYPERVAAGYPKCIAAGLAKHMAAGRRNRMDYKHKIRARVSSQTEPAPGIYDLRIEAPMAAGTAAAGQFVMLYPQSEAHLLARPISICGADPDTGILRLVYRVVGQGTAAFSALTAGDEVELVGPLGNGFPIAEKKALLVGGGIGIPPMLELAKRLPGEKIFVAGYANAHLFLYEDMCALAPVYVSTDDGSAGTHGTVLDAIRENGLTAEVLYACGPVPMLRAVKEYAAAHALRCYLSMEERMACGIGACYACVCRSTEVDSHTNVHLKRICKDGPVFDAREIEL